MRKDLSNVFAEALKKMIVQITKNSKYDGYWELLRDRKDDGYTTLFIEHKVRI